MKHQYETPLYATLLYEVRKQLDISWLEYVYLDMVYHLSKDGWCYKSIDNSALDMGISRVGLIKMRKRLIDKKLLVKNIKGYVKTSVIVNKVYRNDPEAVNLVTKPVNKVYSTGKQSLPKNNNRITIYNKDFKNVDYRGSESDNKEKLRLAIKSGDFSMFKKGIN